MAALFARTYGSVRPICYVLVFLLIGLLGGRQVHAALTEHQDISALENTPSGGDRATMSGSAVQTSHLPLIRSARDIGARILLSASQSNIATLIILSVPCIWVFARLFWSRERSAPIDELPGQVSDTIGTGAMSLPLLGYSAYVYRCHNH